MNQPSRDGEVQVSDHRSDTVEIVHDASRATRSSATSPPNAVVNVTVMAMSVSRRNTRMSVSVASDTGREVAARPPGRA